MIFAVIVLQFAVINFQLAVINFQFAVINLQIDVIILQFAVIDLQNVGLLYNNLQPISGVTTWNWKALMTHIWVQAMIFERGPKNGSHGHY